MAPPIGIAQTQAVPARYRNPNFDAGAGSHGQMQPIPMSSRTFYAGAAATLLVLLGLGLIYLVVMDRMSLGMAFAAVVAAGAVIPVFAAFRELDDQAPRRRRRRREH